MDRPDPVVFVVDDEPAVLKAVARLMRSLGIKALTFPSAQKFLDHYSLDAHGCIILDIAMPGLNGLDLQRTLAGEGAAPPIIFLTGRADIAMSVRAMKQGAADLLTKPVHDADLIRAVRSAIERDREAWNSRSEVTEIQRKLATLTPREREVLEHVISGKLNKQTAADLGTVEKTIKVHRAHVMEKMNVESLAQLVRLADKAGIAPALATAI
jgi:FixJ family two-component response regulator